MCSVPRTRIGFRQIKRNVRKASQKIFRMEGWFWGRCIHPLYVAALNCWWYWFEISSQIKYTCESYSKLMNISYENKWNAVPCYVFGISSFESKMHYFLKKSCNHGGFDCCMLCHYMITNYGILCSVWNVCMMSEDQWMSWDTHSIICLVIDLLEPTWWFESNRENEESNFRLCESAYS